MTCRSCCSKSEVKVFESDLQYSDEPPLRAILGSIGRLDGGLKTIA